MFSGSLVFLGFLIRILLGELGAASGLCTGWSVDGNGAFVEDTFSRVDFELDRLRWSLMDWIVPDHGTRSYGVDWAILV